MMAQRVPDFEAIADDLVGRGLAEHGTMMGHPCLRVNGAFIAAAGHSGDELIVKLSAPRVRELVDEGIGQPFAPVGKVFREWVSVDHSHLPIWRGLVMEARGLAEHAATD
ncbi:hypothetical protein ACFWN7_14345 [Agromyces sp. NPDC058484]|uniref:hypothetical protein n=1 Tax=Agromyces sp. NPDC058484 TaxID=3346524 RepID=UPI003658E4B6